ncbi:hypothetical protein [Pseudomonas sp. GOM6]|uniref:hypothetical protein n=1 Tax=Pseudomonas sp. GOM6 TaxID=3036944 RepID=UPI002409A866|nr:hypothetical protein [Pseudomonas sp. GOM6]MDG1581002.1 hypothetical protein [Pseudomonas sp. GOM6]
MKAQIWERTITEVEWPPLLASKAFMANLIKAIEDMLGKKLLPGESLLIKNWPKEAHEALLPMLPERLAGGFDLSAFRADGSCPYLDETEGFRVLTGYEVAGPAGYDESQLTPYGSFKQRGPYADIVSILRVPLPIRLDRTRARVRVVPDEGDLILMVGQFRCGQALQLENGSFRVEEEVDGGKTTVTLADGVSQDTAADLLLQIGRRQAVELAPRAQ